MPTILLIEDQKELLFVNRLILERGGYRTLVADNGTQGLDMLRDGESKIDLVILDDQMPDLSGHDICVAMRQDSVLRYVQVIVYTAGAALSSERFADLQIERILLKPCTPKELLSAVGDVLSVQA